MFGGKKSWADITILEPYISTRKIQQKSTFVKIRYKREATALLPLINSLVKTVQHDEKQSAFSELEKTRSFSLETNKKHSIRLAAPNQLLIQFINKLVIIRKMGMVKTISSSLTATAVICMTC